MKSIHSPIAAAAGLPEREAAIWQALAAGGPLNISQIARQTGLHRPAVYQLVPRLVEKGLVRVQAAGRRTVYASTGATAFTTWRAKSEQALQTQLETMVACEKAAGALSDDVCVYQGKEGLRRVWERLAALPKGSVFQRFDGYAPGTPIESYLPQAYFDAINKKQIDRFVITNARLRGSKYKRRIECASRMLPASFDAFVQGVSWFIFGDSVAFVDFTTEQAFVIRNEALASYQRRLFEFVYAGLKE